MKVIIYGLFKILWLKTLQRFDFNLYLTPTIGENYDTLMDKNKYYTLINLLDDPDRYVYQEVSKSLVDFGEEIIPELEKSWESSISDIVQLRIEEIMKQIHFETIKTEFEKWLKSEEQDIVEGAFWIAKYQFPDIKLLEIKYFLEDIARRIWL